MKERLKIRLGDLVLVVLMIILFAGTIRNSQAQSVKNHPRVFFQKDELKEFVDMRLTTHETEWESLLLICEKLNKMEPIERPKSKLVFSFPEKLAAVALVQLLDPKQKYQETFEKHFWTILKWKEWDKWIDGKGKGPGGDLGIAQALIALTASYDWQYQNFTKKERKYINQRLVRIAHHFYEDYSRFHTNNFAIMNCNHGTNVYAALSAVLYGVDDVPQEYKKEWTDCLEHKYETLTSQMNSLMSDGFSDEGATYFMFQLKTYVQWMELRRNALEKAYGEPYQSLDWFKNASAYCMYSILPGGKDNFGGLARYADANPKFWGNPYSVFPALAKNLKDPLAQWLSSELELGEVELWRAEKKTEKDQDQKSNYDVWRYIWKDASVPAVDVNTLPNWRFFEDAGMYVWRSSWKNDASYFTIKSGQHYQGHGHPDDGQFMLHRAGVPYIIDMGYSNPKYTHEHNVLLVNGEGQVGDGDVWCEFGEYPGNKAIWGKTDVIISTGNQGEYDYFNLVCDPSNMYPSKDLNFWHREVLACNGLFLIRDEMQAKKEVDFDLLLHSYASRKGKKDAYEYTRDREVNPFYSKENKEWLIDPRKGKSPLLLVKDLSSSNWSDSVEEAWFYDNYLRKKDGIGHVQLGHVLKRRQKAKEASSLLLLGFQDQLEGKRVVRLPEGEGLQIQNEKGDILTEISWSEKASLSQLKFTGDMAGIRFDKQKAIEWFGRDIRKVSHGEKTLLVSDKQISVHAFIKEESMVIDFNSKEQAQLSLAVPSQPVDAEINGRIIDYSFENGAMKFHLEGGMEQKLEIKFVK
ncbi:DUF4962 domain-containing protein [Marinifilum sp. D737]|uniref:DUF4962 domain-containing protein n=1 Tax=Marinifilum sp. D737 TaxID=2969628 RepID=UPI0022751F9C|nr:DUF4962 domain-containing protein [Marinifilum sp. D737]MCY1634303.1 DUF4962 domain-containing protein [Marinifilum sp. D737]